MIITEDGNAKDSDNPLVLYAEEELKRGLYLRNNDTMEHKMANSVIELLRTFSSLHVTGMIGSAVLSLFTRLVQWMPLTPLTGEDDEWEDAGEAGKQNKRCPSVFMVNGDAHDKNGRVFIAKNGVTFTAHESIVPITFPYMPQTQFINEGTPEAEPYKTLFEQVKQDKVIEGGESQ